MAIIQDTAIGRMAANGPLQPIDLFDWFDANCRGVRKIIDRAAHRFEQDLIDISEARVGDEVLTDGAWRTIPDETTLEELLQADADGYSYNIRRPARMTTQKRRVA